MTDTTKAKAYDILGVDPNSVAASVKITPLLDAIGGRTKAIEYLRVSDNPIARKFTAIYDSLVLPRFVRYRLPIEAFCIAAGVQPAQLLQVIGQAVREINQFEAAVAAATSHPNIVKKSTDLALEGDIGHATLNMKHMAFLPLPKGSQVQVNVNANANANATAQSATVLAPSPENTIRRLVNRFNLPTTQQQAALPEAKETVPLELPRPEREAVTIDAEYEEDSDE